jgi:hypothetical protein
MNEDEYFKLDFKAGDYFKDTENKYTPFIGTWKWVENNDQLIIVIEKIEKVYDNFDNTYADYLVGKYKYIKNNIEVINTLNLVINRDNILVPGTVVPLMTRGYDSDTYMSFGLNDILKNKSCDASLEILMPDIDYPGTRAQFKLWDKEHWNIDGENPLPKGFTLPTNIILTKQ